MKRLAFTILGAILAALLLAGPAFAAGGIVELPSQAFTGAGSPGGSFGNEQVAVEESSGDLFILDGEHDAVDRYHFNGTAWQYVSQIKGEETQTGAGSLNTGSKYSALAVDQATGDLYVLITDSQIVFAFAPSSSSPSGYAELWQHELGPEGHFAFGFAVDSQGQPWINDQQVEVIQLSAATGQPSATEHFTVAGGRRIAFDSTGALYIAQGPSGGVDKYVGGSFEHTIDAGSGEFAVATEAGTGNLFATIPYQGIKEWDSSGNAMEPFASATTSYKSITVDAAHHRVFAADWEQSKIHAFALPAPLPINVNGEGTVECEPTPGFKEACGSFLPGEVVNLVASAEPGYAFAGWIGCKQTGENTCEVTVGEGTEVTAIFLKEAESAIVTPFSGNQHGCVNGGLEITVGQAHSYLCNGSNGTNGANGQNGATGPQGPQGPAGNVSVTCKVKQKGKKVKVTCTVKQSASASSVHWRLMRAGHAYRHGVARHGRLSLGALSSGHYRLWVEGQKGATEIVIG